MGTATCSQYMERGASEQVLCQRLGCSAGCVVAQSGPAADGVAAPMSACADVGAAGSGIGDEGPGEVKPPVLAILNYVPPPSKETFNESKALVGTTVPRRPRAEEAVTTRPPPTRPHEATSGLRLGQSCGRPGDAPNQVYVQFSNDLEGWLPYTLLISEEEGLMFKSLSLSPDFTLSIRSIRKVEITSMFAIQQDAFFGNHTRSVIAHLMQGSGYEADDDTALAHVRRVDQERVRPPYNAVVQLLCSNFTSEVVVFVAVQSDALAAELTRSCNATRKRCATKKVFMANQDEYDFDPLVNDLDNGSGYFSRGCPTTRSMGATTPGTGTGAAATPLLGSRTPMKIPEL